MTLWHASTDLSLRLTTAAAVVAKTVYLATRYMGQQMSRLEAGLGLGHSADRSAELELTAKLSARSAELDTSG